MKLSAGRGIRDAGDIKMLLEVCGVTSIAEAHETFDRCFPNEEIAERAELLLLDLYPES